MEKILILGASGLVGRALCNELKSEYRIYGTYNNNKIRIDGVEMIKFEIKNSFEILEILYNIKPDKIIISLTGDKENQLEVIQYIATYSKQSDLKIYFISSWNVFDENPDKIYYENDDRLSDTDYGLFKIKAEDMLN